MDRRYFRTMGKGSWHENLRDNVATANNFATFKNVIEKSKISTVTHPKIHLGF